MQFPIVGSAMAAVGLAALLAAAPVAARADEFTPAQKREIGGIVKDYLLNNPEVLRAYLGTGYMHGPPTGEAHA